LTIRLHGDKLYCRRWAGDVNTSSKDINSLQNSQAKAVQPKKKAADQDQTQNSEAGPKRNIAPAVLDKVSISARGVEASQLNSQTVNGGTKLAPKPRS
jgi:hypothetical protein